MNEQARGNRWIEIASACVLVILYAWLRSVSGLWQYRWTGVLMGLALGYARRGRQAGYDIAKRYDVPRRVYLVGAVVFTVSGTLTLRRFVFAGGSDDGFFGVLLLSLAIDQAIIYRWLAKRETTELPIDEQKLKPNHG
jgi:hypothetical protein